MATVVVAALLCGMAMARLRQPPIVGYILAGVLLGPSALGLVHDRGSIEGLADLGVLMLLFVVGMELGIRAFLVTWRLALTAVVLQTVASVGVVLVFSTFLGFTIELSILLGFVIALSSTAVAIKIMEDIGLLRTRVGRIAVAVLIAQDLAFLPMLLVVENMGRGGIAGIGINGAIEIAASVALLVALIQVLGRQRRIELPFARLMVGNADLSPLSGLVYCFGAAALVGAIGLKPAYGAFLAGLVIGRSAQRQLMLATVQPIQSVLLMVFFLSIGLLIDLRFIVDNVATVLLLLTVVTLFKTGLNVVILRYLGETWPRAFLAGALMSQIGEFSFLLAASGVASGAIGADESRLVIAVTVLSLALSPFWLASARRVQRIAQRRTETLRELLVATYGEDAEVVRKGALWVLIRGRRWYEHGREAAEYTRRSLSPRRAERQGAVAGAAIAIDEDDDAVFVRSRPERVDAEPAKRAGGAAVVAAVPATSQPDRTLA
jgi:CPA2 family monovalent cation:H+ antiporter-2